MTDQITDFTKSRLTQAFEAKGNAGSRLLEELQPVVVTHSLELGPFAPFKRFSWAVQQAAVAAQFSNCQIAPQAAPADVTVIIDSIYVDRANSLIVFPGSGLYAEDTAGSPNNIIVHDTRLNPQAAQNLVLPYFQTLKGASILQFPLSTQILHITTAAGQRVDMGIVMSCGGFGFSAFGTVFPTLAVIADVVNVPLTVNLHGRLYEIQS